MTNYDDVSAEEARLAISMAGDAELDELRPGPPTEDGQVVDGLDSERLASWNLRRIRDAFGISQQQIADRLASSGGPVRLSQSQIAKIERGERPWRLNEWTAIAEALGVSPLDFFSGQYVSDDPSMELYAARMRLQRARMLEEDARTAWREAAKVEREAERVYLAVAARQGGRDEHALGLLEGRWYHQDYVASQLEAMETPWVPDVPDIERRRIEARAYAEREWEKLVKHAESRGDEAS